MLLWRVSDFADLAGLGGTLAQGRWHSKGRPIVYTAESSALALLEVLAGMQVGEPPAVYQLLRIEAPDDLGVAEFPNGSAPDLAHSQAWGDAWLGAEETPLARVPSAVAPYSFNLLLNPRHPDSSQVAVVESGRWPWDKRLFR